jgi:putative redox protein
MKTTTTWKTGQAFVSDQNGASVEVDAQKGFSPKALLLTGLAACSGIDVVEILEKMRLPFAGLVIEVEAEQTENHPKVFREIEMHYKLTTDESNRDKIKKAIDLSLQKYCGVAAMLRKNSEIRYSLTITPEAG